jgi:mRNA interferase MazF
MIACDIGDIVSVAFPFSDLLGRKRRPGLVLALDTQDALLARLTTHPPRDVRDTALRLWAEAGLPRPSTVRLTKLATVDRRLVHHRIGRLQQEDAQNVAQAVEGWLKGLLAEHDFVRHDFVSAPTLSFMDECEVSQSHFPNRKSQF